MTDEQIKEANCVYNLEQRQRYNERQIRKYKRLKAGSTAPENVKKYSDKLDWWEKEQKSFLSQNQKVLERRPELEKIFPEPPKLTEKVLKKRENNDKIKGGKSIDVFKKAGKKYTTDENLSLVNPNREKQGYTKNCGNCTLAYEARNRGIDVEASSAESFMSILEYESMFEDATFAYLTKPMSSQQAIKAIEKEIKTWGNGARGTVFVKWPNLNIGHFFSCKVENGVVKYVDAQTNNTDVSAYFEYADSRYTAIMRLDDKAFSDNVIAAFKEREKHG